MSSESPPSKWLVDTGVWGTHCDREETLNQTGNHSLKLIGTTPANATKLLSPWLPVRGGWNNTYAAWALLRASSIAGGNTVTVKCQGYQDDRSTTTTAITVVNAAVLGAPNTWEWHGLDATFASNTRWARFEIEKAAQNFDVYIDHVQLEKFPPGAVYERTITDTLASGASWVTVDLNASDWESEISFSAGSDQITVHVPGIYQIDGWAEVSGLSDGDYVEIRVLKNGATALYGSSCPAGAAGTVRMQAARLSGLDSGDYVELQLRQQTGAGLTIEEASLGIARIGSLPN
jgi:hypothetical protein